MILAGVGSISDADAALFDTFSSKSRATGDHLCDPAPNGMLDNERSTIAEDARPKAIRDLERYVLNHAYVIPTEGSNTW